MSKRAPRSRSPRTAPRPTHIQAVPDPVEQIAAIYPSEAPDTRGPGGGDEEPPARRTKVRWLRTLLVLSGLGLLATISAIFGMMMAVASDLPAIDVLDVPTRVSHITDRDGNDLGVLTGNEKRLLVKADEISPAMKHAVVAIEDKRFYTNSGVDLRGIARAAVQDVVERRAVQGASTIAQQLVKNRLEAQNDRTIFQKLRESAMAFHMTRKWDKERILRNYLNTIYFGNGAYGIESAARTYFGEYFGLDSDLPKCGSGTGQRRCASVLLPAQAALIAGVVANPSAYDPAQHPVAARERRDLVLLRMREQDYLSQADYENAVRTPLPRPSEVRPPQDTSKYPYFTTWVRQQVVDKIGAGRAFEGGLQVQTTIDSDLQEAAQDAIVDYLGGTPGQDGIPAAALVALDNRTSEVLAMVGGNNDQYNLRPFNLATQGQRQPGSSFKPFILAEALQNGYTPYSPFYSEQKDFCVTRNKRDQCTESFQVNNYDDNYSGSTNLANATYFSDNSVYAELGIDVGTKKISRLARRLGVRTPVSSNYAMTLGGLQEGVTVLDMAHAYESFASGGNLVYGSMSPGVEDFEQRDESGTVPGPVGIRKILEPRDPGSDKYRNAKLPNGKAAVNKTRDERIIPPETAATVQTLLQGVVSTGTGERAAVSGTTVAGKTGTTENYGDAWFVGWSPEYTVAVWVGYPDGVQPMEPPTFSYQGEPVAGGTYPAAIWGAFMRAALAINPPDADEEDDEDEATTTPVPVTGTAPETETAPAPETETAPAPETETAPAPETETAPAPETETAPAPETETAPAPAPESPATEGSGGAAAPAP